MSETESRKLERRLKDKRYRRNQEAINEAFFGAKGGEGMTMRELADRAGVSRATIYRHHKNVQSILPNIETKVLNEYQDKVVRKTFKQHVRISVVIYQTVTFVWRNKREFELVVGRRDAELIEEMIRELLPRIAQRYRWPVSYREVLRIYESEVTAVLKEWVMDDFKLSRIEVMRDILFLTRSVRERLLPIGR